jgi:arginase
VDAGVVLPGRYVDSTPPGRVRNQDAVIDHALRLSHRLAEVHRAGRAPLVLGGDCSLVLGAGLASRARGGGGLVHVDGHTDFRHPGNSSSFGALAGEDLAAAVGRHLDAVADIRGLRPYFHPEDTVHIGCRADDEHRAEASAALALTIPADEVILHGAVRAAARTRSALQHTGGYWVQVDVDILDPVHMPAVDSPDPGGLSPDELITLLQGLAPHAWGASVTVFDPDLDPDGRYARAVARIIAEGLGGLGTKTRQARARPIDPMTPSTG